MTRLGWSLPLIAGGVMIAAALAGKSARSSGQCGDPNASGTQRDGDCCTYSINCQAGSVCNDPAEELFDPQKPTRVCVHVVCAGDNECAAPKTCGLQRLCEVPACRVEDDCSPGLMCLGGRCAPPPSLEGVASCTVLTPGRALVVGSRVELRALASDAHGRAVPGIRFDWVSRDPGVVDVAGSLATAGPLLGTGRLEAAVAGKPSVTCAGPSITVFGPIPEDSLRVVIARGDTGEAIRAARVVVEGDGGTRTSTTDESGAAVFAGFRRPDAITIVQPGFEFMTVLSPGTNDVFVPLAPWDDPTKSGGFRGSVDISATKKADFRLGFVGRPLPATLLDTGRTEILGEPVHTRIFDIGPFDLGKIGCSCNAAGDPRLYRFVEAPGGLLSGLGTATFSDDHCDPGGGVRCHGTVPAPNTLGCDVVRTPPGPTAAWALAGQVRLSRMTSWFNSAPPIRALPPLAEKGLPLQQLYLIADLMTDARLKHGVSPLLDIEQSRKIAPDARADCADPAVASDPKRCQSDFAKYRRLDLTVEDTPLLRSIVQVPLLPQLRDGACPEAAILIAGAALPGRGSIPLGASAGFHPSSRTSCKIEAVRQPFGNQSPPLPDGFMPLTIAPPHQGLEGSPLVLLLFAVGPEPADAAPARISAVVARRTSIPEHDSFADLSFLPYPSGVLSAADATFSGTGTPASARTTLFRLDIEGPRGRWLIYASPDRTAFALPSDHSVRAVLQSATRTALQNIRTDATYSEVFRLGSAKTLDLLADHLIAFSEETCDAVGRCGAK